MSMTIGLFTLSIGTFLGGVWANESWGRYWAWDPKETWALISIIVYAIVLHLRFVPKLNNNFVLSTAGRDYLVYYYDFFWCELLSIWFAQLCSW